MYSELDRERRAALKPPIRPTLVTAAAIRSSVKNLMFINEENQGKPNLTLEQVEKIRDCARESQIQHEEHLKRFFGL